MGAYSFVKRMAFFAISAAILFAFWVAESHCAEYQQLAGLIDLRTTFSDGAYDLEYLVQLAKRKGFRVLVINDHDRMVMEYGLPPFRNIFKKRTELNSINKRGAEEYLNSIMEIGKKYPDMIIIPGSETASFYYWTGSYFKKNLTARSHERRILTIGLERAEDKGKRDRPAWGISTADFHKEGEAGEKLGNFPTVFFVHRKTKKEILKALKNGKMYACQGNYPQVAKIDEFSVCSSKGEVVGISGDEVVLEGNPRIKISLSAAELTKNRVKVRLIRSGEVIEGFEGELPMEIDFEDAYYKAGTRIYYRMDLHGYGTLVSNPIFVMCK